MKMKIVWLSLDTGKIRDSSPERGIHKRPSVPLDAIDESMVNRDATTFPPVIRQSTYNMALGELLMHQSKVCKATKYYQMRK